MIQIIFQDMRLKIENISQGSITGPNLFVVFMNIFENLATQMVTPLTLLADFLDLLNNPIIYQELSKTGLEKII